MSDRMPEDMPDRMPEDLPDRMPEDMPEHLPEDMPDRMPEDMSDRMPQDWPVRKCINVMVGITRSKVIFCHVSSPERFSFRHDHSLPLCHKLHVHLFHLCAWHSQTCPQLVADVSLF